jgi:hypothetical protein
MALARISNSAERVVAVTAGLALTGALAGALCATVAVTVIVFIETKSAFIFSADFFRLVGMVAAVGAAMGIVAAPALAWGLLRRVPLGRAILVTCVGTIIGVVLGEMLFPLNPYRNVIPGAILGGWSGFLLAGVALRVHSGRV